MSEPIYERFLGKWILDVASCIYEQGDPPKSGTYEITKHGEKISFRMQWVDAENEAYDMTFSGVPDGEPTPFAGGDLADALSITAVSKDRLNTSAYMKGVELMIATRTLSEDGASMRITQTVRLPDGTEPTNTSTYHRMQ